MDWSGGPVDPITSGSDGSLISTAISRRGDGNSEYRSLALASPFARNSTLPNRAVSRMLVLQAPAAHFVRLAARGVSLNVTTGWLVPGLTGVKGTSTSSSLFLGNVPRERQLDAMLLAKYERHLRDEPGDREVHRRFHPSPDGVIVGLDLKVLAHRVPIHRFGEHQLALMHRAP